MTTSLQGVQLSSGKVLQYKTPTITIEEKTSEVIDTNQSPNGILPKEEDDPIPQT